MQPALDPHHRWWPQRLGALRVCATVVTLLACPIALTMAVEPAGASQAGLNPGRLAGGNAPRAKSTPGGTVIANATAPSITPTAAQGLDLLLAVLPLRYANADPTHELAPAAVVRALAQGVRREVLASGGFLRARNPTRATRAIEALDRLTTELQATTTRFQPWPLTLEVSAWSARARAELDAILRPPRPPALPYPAIATALEQVASAASAGQSQEARFAALRAFALYAAGPGERLETQDPSLDAKVLSTLLLGSARHPALVELLADGAPTAAVVRATGAANADMSLVAESLAEVRIGHTTIVVDAAIIVFREGLEAVLIIAAITASFVGAKRHLRRPVLLGALAGLGATALTWVIAQMILHLLSNGGLELQAVTGLLAIAVLLLVTNWFFHRVYWSAWISRFNRRRKALERFDRLGFISGQTLGFVLLGLSSVYREGLETVLFLQALQTSAGTSTTLLGAGIGLGGTALVGGVTFKLQRKLPFKRMLIITGVLIALVLAVMVGTTVHNLQAIGWVANTPTSFSVPLSWNMWLGIYPTWVGIAAQLGALVFVLGSYFAARELQVRRPQRRARRVRLPATPSEA